MTAIPAGQVTARARTAAPPPVNWTKIGVLVVVVAHLVTIVWFAATVNAEVGALQKQVDHIGMVVDHLEGVR